MPLSCGYVPCGSTCADSSPRFADGSLMTVICESLLERCAEALHGWRAVRKRADRLCQRKLAGARRFALW